MSRVTLNGFPVERRKLADLVKSPYNPRRMPEDQAAALRRSLAEFGTVEPIIVNRTTGHVVGGHMRLDALKEMGEIETDVLIVELPEEREKALNIALNRISGEWEEERLADLLRELQASGDAALTGFGQDELAGMLEEPSAKEKPTHDLSPELMEEHNYVLFYFDNTLDWQVASQALNIKTVRSLKSDEMKGGQAGIGRVLPGNRLLNMMKAVGLC